MEQTKIVLYGLSTCIHCSHAKGFLDHHSVVYESIMLDMLAPEERVGIFEKVRIYNPNCSFPTLVVKDGVRVIVGFDEDLYKELVASAA